MPNPNKGGGGGGGGGVSIAKSSQAVDDLFTAASTGLTEDSYGFVLLDVMANDGGGKSRALYSVDDGTNSLTDLLVQDTARSAAASSDRSAHGATIWITTDGRIGYDANTLDPAFRAQLQQLAPGEQLTDSFTYSFAVGNSLSWATVTV